MSDHVTEPRTPLVTSSLSGEVATVTITRDQARNALNLEVCRDLRTELRSLIDASVRAIVLTGAGSAFCAGADLDLGPEAEGLYPAILATLADIQNAPIPVIAHVNGPAVGAGTLLAMACDLRVVAPEAWFKVPAVDVAIALDGVSVRSLERLVGGSRARAMLLASARLSAEDALDCGFALEHGDLAAAHQLAHTLAAKAPLTMRHLKAEFTHDGYQPLSEEARARLAEAAPRSADTQEARAARAEKRAPVFRGV